MKEDKQNPTNKRIGCMGCGLRALGALIGLFLLLFLAAFVIEEVTLAQLPEKYPPPGKGRYQRGGVCVEK